MAGGQIGNADAMERQPSTPPKLILAIDDEPEILEIIKQCLEMEGFQVLAASGPKEGLKSTKNGRRRSAWSCWIT